MMFDILKFFRKQKYPLGLLDRDPEDKRDILATEFIETLPLEQLPEEYNLMSEMTSIQSQFYGSCFPAGTPILMEDLTEKPIEKVRLYDFVYTHKGKVRKVSKVYKRWNGRRILEIKAEGLSPFFVTLDHPILTKSAPEQYMKKRNVNDGLGKAEFKNAEELKKQDFIAVPLIQDYRTPSLGILENKDFLRFLGYYLAEGSLDKCKNGKYCRLTLTLNIKEKDFIQDVKRISERLFGITPSIKETPEHNRTDIRIYDTALIPLIQRFCGKLAWEKQLSSELMQLKPSLQKNILDGWFRGDGHTRGSRKMGVTTSPILARQLWWILIRNKIPANLKPHSFVGLNRRQVYDVDWTEGPKLRRKFFDGGYLWCRVSRINKALIRENVYNLEVEDDNSYIANGVAVHNCTSHSVDGVKEYQESKEEGKEMKLANRFIYHNTKKISGLWDMEGDYLRHALKSVEKYGVPLEEDFPDTPESNWKEYVTKEPSFKVYQKALKYKAKGYIRVPLGLESFRSAVYKNKMPICMGMQWYKNYKPASDGKMPLPDPAKKSGGHAISYTGWTKGKEWFRNSWGTNWGLNGYFYIPTNEFSGHSIWDGWTLFDLPNDWQDNNMKKLEIIGDNNSKKQYLKGEDGKLRHIFNVVLLNELHNAGIIDKNVVKWVDDIGGEGEIVEPWAVIKQI